jgi:4-carboxymuconolactone decarboxylase
MSKESEDLREITRRTAELLFGPPDREEKDSGASAYALWREFDPELAKHISMFYTGRLYARQVLTHKQRELCAVASLTTLGMRDELAAHIKAAMNVGATREEVAEVIFQMTTYAGVPKMVEGLRVLKEVLEKSEPGGAR